MLRARRRCTWVCALVIASLGSITAVVGSAIAAQLPNDRAYELVSPSDKNGGDVLADTSRARAASDGDALGFASLTGFADVQGTGIDVDYMSTRTDTAGTSGWTTHALTPQQGALSSSGAVLDLQPLYVGDFSADLSQGVLRVFRPVTDAPEVKNISNLYLRTDLRRPGGGSYQLLSHSDAVQPVPPFLSFNTRPSIAAASTDFRHVLFESMSNLTANAVGFQPKLYEWANGTTRLAGVLPDGSAPARSMAGLGAAVQHYTERTISADGSRIFFFVPSTGQVYARIDGSVTVQLSASEKATPGSPGTAAFGSASADGTSVFFSTDESLSDADTNLSVDLYRWQKADHDEEQELSVDATGGTYTLALDGQITGPIDRDATGDAVRSELEALPGCGVGNVEVTGGPGGSGGGTPYEIRFTRALGGVDVHELTTDSSGLVGGAASASVTITRPVTNLTLISRDTAGLDEPNVDGVIGASADGKYVYFTAHGQLLPTEPEFGTGEAMYLWHDGLLTYIGWLTEFGDTVHNSSATTWSLVGDTQTARVSPDGRHLLFMSHSDEGLRGRGGFAGADQGSTCTYDDEGGTSCRELYLYDADTGALRCASCKVGGAAAGDALVMQRTNSGGSSNTSHLSHALSDDGRYVFFATKDALVPADVNGKLDVYEYDAVTGSQHLLSSGTSPSDSFLMDASPSGHDVFFLTRDRLVGWDVDTNYDVYDARVDGGVPEPAAQPRECSGSACQGPRTVPPAAAGSASASFRGAGETAPGPRHSARRCRHGTKRKVVRGKVKCVRKHKRASAHTRRAK